MMSEEKCLFLVPAQNHNQDNKPSARVTFKITVQDTEATTGLRPARISTGDWLECTDSYHHGEWETGGKDAFGQAVPCS